MDNFDPQLILYAEDVRLLFGWDTCGAVYMAARRGQLPARKWGKRVVFLRAELERYFTGLPHVSKAAVGIGAK